MMEKNTKEEFEDGTFRNKSKWFYDTTLSVLSVILLVYGEASTFEKCREQDYTGIVRTYKYSTVWD